MNKSLDFEKKYEPSLLDETDDDEIHEKYIELIRRCWDPKPDERPSFMQIVQTFLNEKEDYFNMDIVDKIEFEDLAFW